jgi:hypothetical protein
LDEEQLRYGDGTEKVGTGHEGLLLGQLCGDGEARSALTALSLTARNSVLSICYAHPLALDISSAEMLMWL